MHPPLSTLLRHLLSHPRLHPPPAAPHAPPPSRRRAIANSGHLSVHIPIIYSLAAIDEDGDGETDRTTQTTFGGHIEEGADVHDIRMQVTAVT